MMKVRDVMTKRAVCCSREMNIGQAVELLWMHNCGVLPVVSAEHKLTGVITDRDICIALGTRNRLPGDVTVGEVATPEAFHCQMDDEIHSAMQTMAEHHIRRLPVIDSRGVPVGVLSMDDVVTHGDLKRWEGGCELFSDEIVRNLKRLYAKPDLRPHAR